MEYSSPAGSAIGWASLEEQENRKKAHDGWLESPQDAGSGDAEIDSEMCRLSG